MHKKEFEKDQNLVCIECSNRIESIFKIYSDGFKDIIECVSDEIMPRSSKFH